MEIISTLTKYLIGYFHIIVSFLMILAAWKWGDWRNWQKYYPTILFTGFGNFIAAYVTYEYPLWVCTSPLLKTAILEFIIACVLIPATILIYLPHFPTKGLLKQLGYIFLWVLIFSLWEWVSCQIGCCKYYNGWSYWWSVAFNFAMFPLMWLHHRRPLWGLIAAVALASFVILYFDIPYSRLR